MNKKKSDISLIKTDYDDFKNLSFFRTQYIKAQEMLREVNEFNQSFLDSKLLSVDEVMSNEHNWLLFQPGTRMLDSANYYSAKLTDDPIFIHDYIKNNHLSFKPHEASEYLAEHIDCSEKTFKHYIEQFVDAYKSGGSWCWSSLEDVRPVYNNKQGWERKVTGYAPYNKFGEFRKRYWDVRLCSPIIRWIEESYHGGGREYGQHIHNLDCFSSYHSLFEDVIKDVYQEYPDVIIKKNALQQIPGTVNLDLALNRLKKEYSDTLKKIEDSVAKYGIRVPNDSYRVSLFGSEKGIAFREHNLIYNPHKVKCIVDYKSNHLIPFMDDDTTVNIEMTSKVLRCTSIKKNQTEPIRYFATYNPHYIHKVTLDFDLKTNELVNTKEETITNQDLIWKEKI